MIKLILGLLGVAGLWKGIENGDDEGEMKGPVIKNRAGVFDIYIRFVKRHPAEKG